MSGLVMGAPAPERVIMAVDTNDGQRAMQLMHIAVEAGAGTVKLGLELGTAIGWRNCSELAESYNLNWVADMKLNDIPNTTEGALFTVVNLAHKPVGITIHTRSGVKSLEAAQKMAEPKEITMIGVTHLTSIDDAETKLYEKVTRGIVVKRESRRAVAGGIAGLVCSPREVALVKKYTKTKGLVTMIPGARSAGVDAQDQKNPETPFQTIINGADYLVGGRQITASSDPEKAFNDYVAEIQAALDALKGVSKSRRRKAA